MGKIKYVRKTVTWDGKRYEVKGRTEAEAVSKLALLRDSLRRGERTVGENSTVDRWFREWYTLYKEPAGLTQKSLAMYREKYEGYVKPAIGSMKLRDVREVHLQRILNSQAGRSRSHVTKLRLVLRELFGKAQKTRMIQFDPAADLALPETTKGKRRSLTEEERTAALTVAEEHRAGLWVLTILYSGLRPGETAALQWKDMDFDRNEIHVHKALESGRGVVKGPKTEAGVRDVPLHPVLREKLLPLRGGPFDPVFTLTNGAPLSEAGMQRMWRSFRRAMDLRLGAKVQKGRIIESVVDPSLTAYCLRHTFCTDLQRAGVPINVAKELMGHSDIAMTANIYTHRDQAVLHAGMRQLAGVAHGVAQKEETA